MPWRQGRNLNGFFCQQNFGLYSFWIPLPLPSCLCSPKLHIFFSFSSSSSDRGGGERALRGVIIYFKVFTKRHKTKRDTIFYQWEISCTGMASPLWWRDGHSMTPWRPQLTTTQQRCWSWPGRVCELRETSVAASSSSWPGWTTAAACTSCAPWRHPAGASWPGQTSWPSEHPATQHDTASPWAFPPDAAGQSTTPTAGESPPPPWSCASLTAPGQGVQSTLTWTEEQLVVAGEEETHTGPGARSQRQVAGGRWHRPRCQRGICGRRRRRRRRRGRRRGRPCGWRRGGRGRRQQGRRRGRGGWSGEGETWRRPEESLQTLALGGGHGCRRRRRRRRREEEGGGEERAIDKTIKFGRRKRKKIQGKRRRKKKKRKEKKRKKKKEKKKKKKKKKKKIKKK